MNWKDSCCTSSLYGAWAHCHSQITASRIARYISKL